ncbi:MAG: sulfatase [Planctomycetota bacterium]|nr:sulfatase [Planctomycetota bacterium]
MLFSRLFLISPLLLGLGACGGDSKQETYADSSLTRLVVRAAGVTDVDLEPRVVAEWSGRQLTEFKANRGGAAKLEDGLLKLGPNASRLTLEDLPGQGSFDQVVITLRAAGGRLHVALLGSKGKELVRTADASDLPRNSRHMSTSVVVEFQDARPFSANAKSLALIFGKQSVPPQIESIQLRYSEPEAWLPAPDAPRLYAIGLDQRRAVGLTARRPLKITVPAALSDAGLNLAFGVPGFLQTKVKDLKLNVTVADRRRAEVWVQRYDVPVGEWDEVTYWPPSDAHGRELEVTFALSDDAEGAACALAVPSLARLESDPKTVLLVTSDTHRGDQLGILGRGRTRTPFLDKIAERGYLFLDCQSEGNNTNPTHVSIFTGVPVRDHGVIGNDVAVTEAALTLAEAFRDGGYHTYGATSAVHLGWSGCTQGFDRFSAPVAPQHDSKITIEMLSKWLESADQRSVFLWLHSFDPHAPYTPPQPYRDMYWKQPKDAAPEVESPSWAPETSDVRRLVAQYRGEVTYFDAALDRLFRKHPRLDQGLVAIIGDHGENMIHPKENWGFSHRGLSQDTLHVPLLITFPGAPSAVVVNRPVQQRDLGRTLLDVAGLPGLEFPGENLLALAEENPDEVGAVSRFAIAGNAFFASVRKQNWLLVQGLYTDERDDRLRVKLHTVQLYDVDKDPSCFEDLAADNHDLACSLRTELVEWLTKADVTGWAKGTAKQGAETLKHLASLGYSASTALDEHNPWIDPACDCEHCAAFPLVEQ